MYLDSFYSQVNGRLCISTEQASRFAKEIAGDYNPIHDSHARRFCVPGDLLFALILARFGLSQQMTFRFHSMVGENTNLYFQQPDDGVITVRDDADKIYLEVHRAGPSTRDESVVTAFSRRYVAFSGFNFPHYLKPLMKSHGVMFHPQRPLVIYDSMDISLETLDLQDAQLEFTGSSLDVDGKRADAHLEFAMTSDGAAIGKGSKKLIISGLRPYDEEAMEGTVNEFFRLRSTYQAQKMTPAEVT